MTIDQICQCRKILARVSPVNLNSETPSGCDGLKPRGLKRRAPPAPVGSAYWAQPADFYSNTSVEARLMYESDLGRAPRAENRARIAHQEPTCV
eukprot:2506128-Pleurochrysis_carterae.AAC.1